MQMAHMTYGTISYFILSYASNKLLFEIPRFVSLAVPEAQSNPKELPRSLKGTPRPPKRLHFEASGPPRGPSEAEMFPGGLNRSFWVAFWEPFWRHLDAMWPTLSFKSEALKVARFRYRFLGISGAIWGGPTRNPIEPARSDRMSTVFLKSCFWLSFCLPFTYQKPPKSPRSLQKASKMSSKGL